MAALSDLAYKEGSSGQIPSTDEKGSSDVVYNSFLAEEGIRAQPRSHGNGEVYKGQPQTNNLPHAAAKNKLRCTKCPPGSNFVTSGAPGA